MSAVRHLLHAELRGRLELLPLVAGVGLLAPWLPWALDAAPPLGRLDGPLLLAGGTREQALQALALLALGFATARHAFGAAGEGAPSDELLRRLPLPRGVAFRARLGSCLVVLLAALALRDLQGLVCGLFWGGALHAGELARVGAAECGLALVGLGLGLRLARWGGLGWACLALLALGSEELERAGIAAGVSLLGIGAAAPRELGTGLLLWSIPALLGGTWARLAFLQPGARRSPTPLGAGPTRVLAGAAALLASLALLFGDRPTPALEPRVTFPRGRVTTRTARYLFLGLAPLPRAARALVSEADQIHDRVGALLGLSLGPGERLRATLIEEGGDVVAPIGAAPLPPPAPRRPSPGRPPGWSPSGGEAGSGNEDWPAPSGDDGASLGTSRAAGGPIPLELGRPGGPGLPLAAATAEALLQARVGERGESRTPAWGVLRAGLVRHVAWRAAGVDPFWSRFHAAVLHARNPLRTDELFEPGRLRRTRGDDAAASLGEVAVAALARRLGDEAIPHLVAALCDDPRLDGPRGASAWRELLPRLGCTLEELHEAVLELLEDEVPGDPRAALALPRLHALEDPQDQPGLRLVAVPDLEVPLGWEVLCRIENMGEPPRRAVSLGRDAKGCWAFNVPDLPWGADLPRVQLGLRPPADAPFRETIWEEWATGS